MRQLLSLSALAAVTVFLTVSQISCGDGGRKHIGSAYERGFHDGAEKVRATLAGKYKDGRERFRSAVILTALAGGLLILLGPSAAEAARRTLTGVLKIPAGVWTALAVTLYAAALIGGLTCCALASSGTVFAAAGILAAFSVHPFWFGYIPALGGGDAAARKIAAGKVKAVLMLAVVLVLIEQILMKGL